jgi:hypothetical protein
MSRPENLSIRPNSFWEDFDLNPFRVPLSPVWNFSEMNRLPLSLLPGGFEKVAGCFKLKHAGDLFALRHQLLFKRSGQKSF